MIGSIATLARWLGPWADPAAAPDVDITNEQVDELRVRVYWPPARPRATYLIAPGLHYAGADDPRMDRFCRILAAGGHLVVAPFIPDYLALAPRQRAKRDFARVFDALPRWSTQKPVVFSISFGSLLAFALAAERADAIDALVIFGGYADFQATLQYCLTGAGRDPLNQPVVLMNLLPDLDPRVVAMWRQYIERTWGRPEMKARERFCALAEELAPNVPEAARELFLIGIGALPGAVDLAMPALAGFDASALDPSPYLPRIRGRVELVHGTDDDVIPFAHSHQIAAQLVNADVRVHITGMYGHTGAQSPRWSAAAKELATMLRVLRMLAR